MLKVKLNDADLKAHYFSLLNKRNSYTGYCDSVLWLNNEMSIIRKTLAMLEIECDWLEEE